MRASGCGLWYLVGLIASDGCLSSDGRHIDITAKDKEFLEGLKDFLGLNYKIGLKHNSSKRVYYHIQVANKKFYNFLLFVGLKPKKSLTLRALKIPRKYFVDFLRGLIDGDGCIRRWKHPLNNREQWSLRIYSGSENFLKWLQEEIALHLKVLGRVHKETARTLWILKYGKMALQVISRKCYPEMSFGLERKRKLMYECQASSIGWSRSNVVTE